MHFFETQLGQASCVEIAKCGKRLTPLRKPVFFEVDNSFYGSPIVDYVLQ
jgi:hypothetical protein